MTQMQNDQITLHSVWGKDRMSDAWINFESRWRWEAEQWAEQRAFVVRDEDGNPIITERQPGHARLEWLVDGEWQPYTAYVPYLGALNALENQRKHNPANRFRIAEANA